MKSKQMSIAFVCLAFIMPAIEARTVEIVGVLQDAGGQRLSGIISVFHAPPNSIPESHEIERDFRISIEAEGGIGTSCRCRGPSFRRTHRARSGYGSRHDEFQFATRAGCWCPPGDLRRNGVAGATVRVHHHEPGKPTPRVTFEPDSHTDGNGEFLVHDVGIDVPFNIDVLAPGHAPTQSGRQKLAAGESELADIVLTKPEALVLVRLRDKIGDPIRGASVTLLVDPANYPQTARGSWPFPRGFRQRAKTSSLGNARFSGVHPGRVRVTVETDDGKAEAITTVVQGVESSLTLTVQ